MTAWLTVLLVGIGTLFLRGSFIAFMGERRLPDVITRGLRFVPAAVLTAIVTPAVFLTDGSFDISFENLRWPAAIVAAVVAWKTRNIAYTIVAGMVALWIAQAVS